MPGILFADRVRETTTTTGSGNLTLSGASTGFRTFGSVAVSGDSLYYVIQGSGAVASEWEDGRGVYLGSNIIQRICPFQSSNSNGLVNLSAGTHFVFIDIPAKGVESLERLGYVGMFV